jgi:hypothetical protein
MLDYIETVKLYTVLGEHLTGRKIGIIYTDFSKPGRGRVTRQGDTFYVQLALKMDEDETFQVLLHELAHVKLHGDRFVDLDHPGKSASGLHSPFTVDQVEDEAQALADRWYQAASDNTHILTPARLALSLLEL